MKIEILEPADPAWNESLVGMAHDTYHRAEYLSLEARRTDSRAQAARITDPTGQQVLFQPFLVRDCGQIGPPDERAGSGDVVSPYGYCGYLHNAAAAGDTQFLLQALRTLTDHWKAGGICSAFLRLHPILNAETPELEQLACTVTASPTVSVDLTQSEKDIWTSIQKRTRTAINKCRRLGYSFRVLDYWEHLDVFREIYQDTMLRVQADASYLFDGEYFQNLGSMGRHAHLLAVEFDGIIAAATLFLECDGIVQSHLVGTRSNHMQASPQRELLYGAALWAKARGNRVLHLGGGLGGQDDSLLRFKSCFSPRRHCFRTVRFVIDTDRYHDLVGRRAADARTTPEALLATNFFPAYRYGLAR